MGLSQALIEVDLLKASPVRRVTSARGRIVSQGAPRIRGSFLRAIAARSDAATLKAIREALGDRDGNRLAGLFPVEPFNATFAPSLRAELRTALEGGGGLEGRIVAEAVRDLFDFNESAQAITDWIRSEAASLVVEVGNSGRAAVRAVLERTMTGGLSVQDAARLIYGGRVVGLTEREGGAVARYRAGLARTGVRADNADELARRYSNRLLIARAERIAQTELTGAYAEGQQQAWMQARAQGLVGADALQQWLALNDADEPCLELNGQTAPVGRPFPGGVLRPPLHVNCRCMLVLLPAGRRA